MEKTIFVTGQCSLHMGRMEYGNLGNYAIAEPLFEQLHQTFPGYRIETTLQMSDPFCKTYNIRRLDMSLYDNLKSLYIFLALAEFLSSLIYRIFKISVFNTGYIQAVKRADLVIDFSGDVWGDNADLISKCKQRFNIGVLKDLTACNFGKPLALICSSLGPFKRPLRKKIAKYTLNRMKLVTVREPKSFEYLQNNQLQTDNMYMYPCPAFLFKTSVNNGTKKEISDKYFDHKKNKIGLIFCGWNVLQGPFNRTDWTENDFNIIANPIGSLLQQTDADLYLLSHNHAFEYKNGTFQHFVGRDFIFAKGIYEILKARGYENRLHLVTEPYDAHATKYLISHFDMLVSGRIHGSVAGLTQHIPTVMLNYGHEPKALKVHGFAKVAGVEDYVAEPDQPGDITEKLHKCWHNRAALQQQLKQRIPQVQKQCLQHFEKLKDIILP